MGITAKSRGKTVHGGVTILDDVTINDALAVTGTSAFTGASTFTGTSTFNGRALIAKDLYFNGAESTVFKFKSDSDYTDGVKVWDTYFGQAGVESYADGLVAMQTPIGTDYYLPFFSYENITEK